MSEACNTLNMDKEPGFTLVELLITIVVATILLAAGVPAFQSFIKNNRVTAQANDLVSAIQLARSEALKRGVNTVVCASNKPAECTGKDTWADGWIVFSDPDRNNALDSDADKCLAKKDCIMRTSKGLSHGSTLTIAPDPAVFLCFLPTGLSGTSISSTATSCTSESSNITSFDFILKAKNCEKNQARKITVTKQGHTQVSTCITCACS